MYIPSYLIKSGRCKTAFPVFNKRRFDPSLIIDVKKCRFNYAQVITCRPFSDKLRPFPTTFWLVCPHLIKLAGKIESQGGVNELENFLKTNNLHKQWHEYNFLHQLIRLKLINKNLSNFMRKYHGKIFHSLIRGGIGGIRYEYENINVKCLHLQTSSFIALGHHVAEKWLKEKNLCGDCNIKSCMKRT